MEGSTVVGFQVTFTEVSMVLYIPFFTPSSHSYSI